MSEYQGLLDVDNFSNRGFVRNVPLAEVDGRDCYDGLALLGHALHHGAVETDDGIWRWGQNTAVRALINAVGMTAVWVEFSGNPSIGSLIDVMKVYMMSGYSLGGFCDAFSSNPADYGLPHIPEGCETLTDYVLSLMEVGIVQARNGGNT